jgi:hypothetical protein
MALSTGSVWIKMAGLRNRGARLVLWIGSWSSMMVLASALAVHIVEQMFWNTFDINLIETYESRVLSNWENGSNMIVFGGPFLDDQMVNAFIFLLLKFIDVSQVLWQ